MKKDWTYKKLGEVAEIKAGFTPSSSELHEAGEYPYYKVSDMNTAGNEVFLISTLSYVKQSKKYFPKGSIAFPKNGAAIATNKKRILKYDSIVDLNTGVCIFDSDILPKFGYYWFQNIDFRNYTRGGALPTLDIKTISLKTLPIPPLCDQELIVRELDAIHGILEKKQEQLRELDNLAQAIFYDMFGDPITNPKQWEVKKWEDVLTIINGKNQKAVENPDGEYVICGSGGIMGRATQYLCPENSVIIGRKGNINKPILMREKYWNVDTAFGIVPMEEKLDVNYIYHFCECFDFENLNVAVTIPSLRKTDLLGISIPLPPLSLQQSFAAKIEAIEAQKTAIRQSIREVEALLAQRMDHYFN